MDKRMSTDEMLAIYAPDVPVSWFKKVRERLRLFKGVNGGDVELNTRFRQGQPQWTKWEMVDLDPKNNRHV